jgi:AcrR family transcriptional regulator
MTTRRYSMEVRAARADATRARIIDAARARFDRQASDVTLSAIAADAQTSVATVLRLFGSKAGLLDAAIGSGRDAERGIVSDQESVVPAVRTLFDDYETVGDRVVRMLADEHRVPGFAEVARTGRADHRQWVEASFAPQLAGLAPSERDAATCALVCATDVYVWKLLRRDLGLDLGLAQEVVARLCRGAVTPETK